VPALWLSSTRGATLPSPVKQRTRSTRYRVWPSSTFSQALMAFPSNRGRAIGMPEVGQGCQGGGAHREASRSSSGYSVPLLLGVVPAMIAVPLGRTLMAAIVAPYPPVGVEIVCQWRPSHR
jgi:hypothetical protein